MQASVISLWCRISSGIPNESGCLTSACNRFACTGETHQAAEYIIGTRDGGDNRPIHSLGSPYRQSGKGQLPMINMGSIDHVHNIPNQR